MSQSLRKACVLSRKSDAGNAWRLVLGVSTLQRLRSSARDFEHLPLMHQECNLHRVDVPFGTSGAAFRSAAMPLPLACLSVYLIALAVSAALLFQLILPLLFTLDVIRRLGSCMSRLAAGGASTISPSILKGMIDPALISNRLVSGLAGGTSWHAVIWALPCCFFRGGKHGLGCPSSPLGLKGCSGHRC